MKRFFASTRVIVLIGMTLAAVSVPADRTDAAAVVPPARHGVAVPRRVSAATIAQVQAVGAVTTPADGGTASARATPSPTSVTSLQAPTSKLSGVHQGLGSGSQPVPDANGAGGLDNYIEAVKGQIAIFSRTGQLQYSTAFSNWFTSISRAKNFFDPNVVYDQWSQRFIFAVDVGNALLVSVAQQTDATKTDFCNYSFPYTSFGLDYDKLGVDQDGIYLSADVLATSTGQQIGNVLYFANRTAMESCQTISYSSWNNLTNPDGSLAYAIDPAVQNTDSNSVEYLVDTYPGGACQLTLWALTSTGSLSNASIATQCYSPPPPAVQKGTTTAIDPGDSSVSHVSYVNGLLSLAVAGSYDWGDGNGSVGIAEWFVLSATTNSVSSQGAFGTPGYWVLYPAVASNSSGNLTFVYGAVGPTSYPNLWEAHYSGGSYGTPSTLMQGTVAWTRCSGSGNTTCRWGDYQSAAPDDTTIDPNGVWIAGQYATKSNAWGTRFALVSTP